MSLFSLSLHYKSIPNYRLRGGKKSVTVIKIDSQQAGITRGVNNKTEKIVINAACGSREIKNFSFGIGKFPMVSYKRTCVHKVPL
jgi:hypothetical protein